MTQDDLWPHFCWGHMYDSAQGSFYPSPHENEKNMWIQWSFLSKTWTKGHWHMTFEHKSIEVSLAPDSCRLLASPNKQSGKYNEMDPILTGTAVSEHVIREMSKHAVPLVKALWQTIIFINIHDYMINNINVAVNERRKPGRKQDFCQHPHWRIIHQNALSLLDKALNIHHFGMW